MSSPTIAISFEENLRQLENMLFEMGGIAEVQLADAMDALMRRDAEAAAAVISNDQRLDELQAQIDEYAVALLQRHGPMATDLRAVITGLQTASVIERIGDYAKNIAKRSVALSQGAPMGPVRSMGRMARLVQGMIKNVLDAYIARDVAKAQDVRKRDQDADLLHTSLFRELLTYMMEDPRSITGCTHLLFIAKNLERIGDHATNIAENVYFLVEGKQPDDEREKVDTSSFTTIDMDDERE